MTKKKRNRRGSVSINERNGVLLLRWTYGGQRHQLSLQILDTPLNRVRASQKATQMELDFITGDYDASLAKDKIVSPEAESVGSKISTLTLFEHFTEDKRRDGVSGQTLSTKYRALHSNIKRYGADVEYVEDARQLIALLRDRQSPKISNQNLVLLKSFGKWLVEQGHLPENPFSPIKPAKRSAMTAQDRTPFTKEELALFLETMRTHPHAGHYYDFTVVLFSLGLRPSEAIGLRWSHINLGRREVTIREAMARSEEGISSGSCRVRKGTKTGNSRVLSMNDRLFALFTARKTDDVRPDDLIFTSPTGLPICDRQYRTRYWKPVCEKAGIRYRPPYVARHTLLTYPGLFMTSCSENRKRA